MSIIIPCYNAAATLSATLDSVVRQTCPNWEAIAVDDGSTDTTPELLRAAARADPRIRPLRAAHAGLSATRNRGLAVARADQALLLDADDLLRPDALAAMLDASARLGGETIISADFEFLDETGRPLPVRHGLQRANFTFARFLRQNPTPPLVMLPRGVLGPDPFDSSLPSCEDWDLWLRLSYNAVRRFEIPRVLFGYRWRRTSMSGKTDVMFAAGKRVLERWLPLAASAEAGRNSLHRWAWNCGAMAVASGDPTALARYWQTLPPLVPEEDFWLAVAESLHGQYARAHGACGRTWGTHADQWLGQLEAWLPTTPAHASTERILAHLRRRAAHADQPPDFAAALRAFLAVRPDSDRIVVYGCGRNGLLLLEQLRDQPDFPPRRLCLADDFADDFSFALHNLPRVDPRTWATWPAATVVALTPNECPAMRDTLLRAGGHDGEHFVHLPSRSSGHMRQYT